MAKSAKENAGLFFETMAELSEGQAPDILGSAMRDLIAAVKVTRKKGKLVLTVHVAMAGKGEGIAMLVTPEVKVTLPQQDTTSTILYATDDNGLTRRDPRQPELNGLRNAAPPVANIRDAGKRGQE